MIISGPDREYAAFQIYFSGDQDKYVSRDVLPYSKHPDLNMRCG